MQNATSNKANPIDYVQPTSWLNFDDMRLELSTVGNVSDKWWQQLNIVAANLASSVIASALQNIPTSSMYYGPIFKVLSEYYSNIWDWVNESDDIQDIVQQVTILGGRDFTTEGVINHVKTQSTWIMLDEMNHQDEVMSVDKLKLICEKICYRITINYDILLKHIKTCLSDDLDNLTTDNNLEKFYQNLILSTSEHITKQLNRQNSHPNYAFLMFAWDAITGGWISRKKWLSSKNREYLVWHS